MKANLPDLLSCLIPQQIEAIDRKLPRREEICKVYERAFADTPIRLPKRIPTAKHARYLFAIHVDTEIRDEAIGIFGENGIGVTVNYRSVPTLTYYRTRYGYDETSFPISYEWGAGTISLPLYLSLTHREQDHVISVVRDKIVPMIKHIKRTGT